jgi:hypothetical protein
MKQEIGGVLTTNSKPPGPIIMRGQSETLNTDISDHIYYTLFFSWRRVQQHLLHLSQATLKVSNFAEAKQLSCDANLHVLTFLHPISLCRITY